MMTLNEDNVPPLANCKLAATQFGITATTVDGRPAQLAVVDGAGKVLEAGDDVAAAAWWLMVLAYNNYWIGKGYIKVVYQKNPV